MGLELEWSGVRVGWIIVPRPTPTPNPRPWPSAPSKPEYYAIEERVFDEDNIPLALPPGSWLPEEGGPMGEMVWPRWCPTLGPRPWPRGSWPGPGAGAGAGWWP